MKPKKMAARAAQIYQDFVAVQAPKEVRLKILFYCFIQRWYSQQISVDSKIIYPSLINSSFLFLYRFA